jgi:hypothetical protein
MSLISIAGLDKAEVLAALYNAARPQGLGHLHSTPEPMGADVARMLLEHQDYFDYLGGRVMKVRIRDEIDPTLYDRDNGAGAMAAAIDALRADKTSP